jgi:hypothetical protein
VRVDVDHDGAGVAWLDAGLPQPTFIIRRRTNGHAHLIWELRRWVRVGTRAERFLRRVRAAFTEACEGDPSYSGRFQHNPLAAWAWDVRVSPSEPYSLGELSTHIDLFSAAARASGAKIDPDNEALGRNCSVFEHVRTAAYRLVPRFRREADYDAFEAAVRDRVEGQNDAFPTPLPSRDVRSLTKSIARWTWSVYGRGAKAAEASRTAAELSRAEYEARATERAQQIRDLRAAGLGATEIARRLGCSVRLVHLRLATTAQSAPLSELAPGAPAPDPRAEQSPRPERRQIPVVPFPWSLASAQLNPDASGLKPAENPADTDRTPSRRARDGCPEAIRRYVYGLFGPVATAAPAASNAGVRGWPSDKQAQATAASHAEVRGPALAVAPAASPPSHPDVRGSTSSVRPRFRPASHAEVRGASFTVAPDRRPSHGEVRGSSDDPREPARRSSPAEVRGSEQRREAACDGGPDP